MTDSSLYFASVNTIAIQLLIRRIRFMQVELLIQYVRVTPSQVK